MPKLKTGWSCYFLKSSALQKLTGQGIDGCACSIVQCFHVGTSTATVDLTSENESSPVISAKQWGRGIKIGNEIFATLDLTKRT